MLKTLAAKHQTSVSKMARKYKATLETPSGRRTCFEVTVARAGRKPLVARFGGIPLRRKKTAVLDDRQPDPVGTRRKQLITRLHAGWCELCDRRAQVQVHQVRRLADLSKPGRPQAAWEQIMAERRRKTLVVCRDCHDAIHTR